MHALNYMSALFWGKILAECHEDFALPNIYSTMWQNALLVAIYCIHKLILVPNMFAEAVLREKHAFVFHNRVEKVLRVAQHREKDIEVYNQVKKFYRALQRKKSEALVVPKLIHELPIYLIIDIHMDISDTLFFHSPTLRRTSKPFKRWLCGRVGYDFKMPHDEFYDGPECYNNLYYIKSGVVQILSSTDKETPIITFTSGTVFGDINFVLPYIHKKSSVRCLTYCEINYISRADILRSLHNFPNDRYKVMKSAKDRIEHAHALDKLKTCLKQTSDISDKESMAWLKRRWWQLQQLREGIRMQWPSNVHLRFVLPPEENIYHCSKYIGQLVLYNEDHLFTKSMFLKTSFPWILTSDSWFFTCWHRVVEITVITVLFLLPPSLMYLDSEPSYKMLHIWTEFVYITDILVSFITYTGIEERLTSFISIALEQCKKKKMLLDVLSTTLLSRIVVAVGMPKYRQLCLYTQLIKIYVLFETPLYNDESFSKYIVPRIAVNYLLLIFCYYYIGACVTLLLTQYIPDLSMSYFFCGDYKNKIMQKGIFNVFKSYTTSLSLNLCEPTTNLDVIFMVLVNDVGFILLLFTMASIMASLYLRYGEIVNFQYMHCLLREQYLHYYIHPTLIQRLQKYVVCHWKRMGDLQNLKGEPYSICNSLHDREVESVLINSKALAGANLDLVRELAHEAKYMIVPRFSTLFLLGSPCDKACWCVKGTIRCEYRTADGQIDSYMHPVGELLCLSSVFFGKIAIRTYFTETDCEIIYLNWSLFWNIFNRHTDELMIIRHCQNEILPVYKKMFAKYIYRNREYRKKILKKINVLDFGAARGDDEVEPEEKKPERRFDSLWISPESRFIRFWMPFRASIVFASIMTWFLQGTVNVTLRRQLAFFCALYDFVAVLDIGIKFFLGYYDKDGLIISDVKMRIKHYMTRSFCADMLGLLPWHKMVDVSYTNSELVFLMSLSRTSHIYMLMGYFDYVADWPFSNYVVLMILKYQMVGLIVICLCAQLNMSLCIDFEWDSELILVNVSKVYPNNCPVGFPDEITIQDVKELFAYNLIVSEWHFLRTLRGLETLISLGMFKYLVRVCGYLIFWYIYYYCGVLLILKFRGSSLFKDGIRQLKTFLVGERVETSIIERSVNYFRYTEFRTCGAGKEVMEQPALYGFLLKQDIRYYFYKGTFQELAKMISLDNNTKRVLGGACSQLYFPAGEDVMREMHVVPYVYIVHRGKVMVTKNDEVIDILRKV